jgi:excisionase family DNA binding protein
VQSLLTVEDVARITQLSVYTVRAAVRDCELVATKIRGRIRVDPIDLQAWIDAGRIQPASTFSLSPEDRDALVAQLPSRRIAAPLHGTRSAHRR